MAAESATSSLLHCLRAAAVLWTVQLTVVVVTGHFLPHLQREALLHSLYAVSGALSNGYLAVEVLLFMSGFLLGLRCIRQVCMMSLGDVTCTRWWFGTGHACGEAGGGQCR